MTKRSLLPLLAPLFLPVWLPAADEAAPASEFLEPTIDLGCVVGDLEKSVAFYTEAIGFKEAGSFEVPGDYAKRVGLTDGKKLSVTILTLGEGDAATKLKLMQVDGSGTSAPNDYIHSTLGFSYLTIFVKSTDHALDRLKEAGVKPLADGPLPLPENLDPSMALTLVRDPDGNIVELVGPKPAR